MEKSNVERALTRRAQTILDRLFQLEKDMVCEEDKNKVKEFAVQALLLWMECDAVQHR